MDSYINSSLIQNKTLMFELFTSTEDVCYYK